LPDISYSLNREQGLKCGAGLLPAPPNINNIVVTFEDAEVAAAEKTLSVIIV
jgi:hypothetical protein